jgi:hypothetical protein
MQIVIVGGSDDLRRSVSLAKSSAPTRAAWAARVGGPSPKVTTR